MEERFKSTKVADNKAVITFEGRFLTKPLAKTFDIVNFLNITVPKNLKIEKNLAVCLED